MNTFRVRDRVSDRVWSRVRVVVSDPNRVADRLWVRTWNRAEPLQSSLHDALLEETEP